MVVVGASAIVGFRYLRSSSKYPSSWDPRVLDIVHFDELHRGLTFDHPVHVDFLTPEQYSARTRSSSSTLTDEDKKELQNEEGELRAFGLISGDVDLEKSFDDLADSGTLAFYDADTQRVSVRGTDLTVNVRVTLAHELTHALQDQHFGIGHDRFDNMKTDQEKSAFRTLVEGDAVRIEDEYVDALSTDERDEYVKQYGQDYNQSKQQLHDVPTALQALQQAPYGIGVNLLKIIAADGGNSAVDAMFTDPPTTDTQLLDPRAYKQHRDALPVDEPPLPSGVSATTDDGDFGALAWYLFLAQRIDPVQALGVVDGWGGDAYIAYEQDGRTCVQLAYQGVNASATNAMESALTAWIAGGPTSGASVAVDGDRLRFTSCDPGATGNDTSDRPLTALLVPILRGQAIDDAVENGNFSIDKGWTYGECFVEHMTFDQYQALNDADQSADLPADLTSVLQQASATCASQLR